ncbi:Phosphatidylserine decarboxylase proenzyme 2 [Lasiodiplodia theobromae]|uniref:Phosphatidylserine decarboxylase proenzyme 2 n=1 Tax=Lasiodiplodia theobromae TaxID=45133 RepID=A0A5N5DZ73_9PEZI|nr:Phosphatidylserine decarboxylase proenzyme 2 [Lasiodiplodia theobromae]
MVNLSSRLSLPARLKSSSSVNTHNTSTSPSAANSEFPSRSTSPKPGMADSKNPHLVLRTSVLKGRDLAAKDKSGTSDPYLVLTLGDAKEATPAINKTLNPEWNQTFDLPIAGSQSLLLEAVCWDKDRFSKDYMGEFDVALEDIFTSHRAKTEQKWFPLQSRKSGKKKSEVSGEVLLQFELVDPSNPSATPEQLYQRFLGIAVGTPSGDDDDEDLERLDSGDIEETEEEESSDEADDADKADAKKEKKRKRLRMKKLRRKAKERAYEFYGSSDVAGVLFLEITKITDLPPEKNITRTGFDMDPFVVTSLGKKTYRTRAIRHNLNPVFEEKLVFQVMKHETNYSLNFQVVDKDKLSNHDYVGAANFPLENCVSVAPQADPLTGLYKLPEPEGNGSPVQTEPEKKKRFRLPISRSASSTSLHKQKGLKKESSSTSLASSMHNGSGSSDQSAPSNGGLAPTSTPGGIPAINVDTAASPSEDFKSFTIPLELKKSDRWEGKHSPTLHIRAKYMPYKALRQQFWRAMLKQYDADDSCLIDKIEIVTMLDTLGSTLHDTTINSFFERFAEENGEPVLTFDQAVICLEDQIEQSQSNASTLSFRSKGLSGRTSGPSTPGLTSGSGTPLNNQSQTSVIPAIEQDTLGPEGEHGEFLEQDDLADEKGEEHVVEIRECPICHQPRLNRKSDADIITHIATCASQDWRQVNNIVMAGFVTSSQAQRKWYSKVITKVSYGGYKLGANSANILVQDRITGQINEERMSVYVRLGIRLLYKGLKRGEMESKKARKLLKSLSIKQGKKYDDPASAAEIPGFINFHQLDMSEVLLPLEEFKTFNEFFYRALKPGARPCSAPNDPQIITSPADCRSVMFNQITQAQKIWVKGREFTMERLIGKAYPDDVKRFEGGALGIFRLAPQDYHRFHIPVDGVMGEPKMIEGEYYTVNPMAIRSALDVYGENVRICVPIDSVAHGRVMVICVGAMMVGSTVITRNAGEKVTRAEELGYFKFGGSTILLLFEPGVMEWDDDLVDNSNQALETLIRVGMSVGHSIGHAPHTPDMRKANPSMQEKADAKRRIEGSFAPSAPTHEKEEVVAPPPPAQEKEVVVAPPPPAQEKEEVAAPPPPAQEEREDDLGFFAPSLSMQEREDSMKRGFY